MPFDLILNDLEMKPKAQENFYFKNLTLTQVSEALTRANRTCQCQYFGKRVQAPLFGVAHLDFKYFSTTNYKSLDLTYCDRQSL
jgi:hypothetical protein